jgi:hypothetical protein
MKLATLKSKLQIVTGTNISQVFVDWKEYLNLTRSKTYPCVLWSFNGMEFSSDIRPVSQDIQQMKEFKITVFAIMSYNVDTDDKILVWDQLESDFYDYLNAINTNDRVVQVWNMDNIKGQYVPEGMISAGSEIGIRFGEVILRTFCNV